MGKIFKANYRCLDHNEMISPCYIYFMDITNRNAKTVIPSRVLFLLLSISKTWALFTLSLYLYIKRSVEQNCREATITRLWKHGKSELMSTTHCCVNIRGNDQKLVLDWQQHILENGATRQLLKYTWLKSHVQVKPKRFKVLVTLLSAQWKGWLSYSYRFGEEMA